MWAIETEAASTTDDETNVNEIDYGDQDNDNTMDNINDQNYDDVGGNSNEAQEDMDDGEDSTDEERITIDDINIVTQMNSSQMEVEEEEQEQQVTHTYNLRRSPTKQKQQVSLAIMKDNKMTGVADKGQYMTTYPKIHAHIMLTQMNVKQGLLTFGEKGNEAILKELRQLHQKNALLPISKENLSYAERKKALRYLMFLKEKRDGTIKARGCADGRPRRQYTSKTEVSSPTVSLEALMLSCAIDAKEGRYTVVADIPGAFLHVDMDDDVHMILEGTIAELIVKLELSLYRKHIWYTQRGKPMLYVQLKKALYGTLQAALLFCNLLLDTLQEWGFKINPCDQCVANKMIQGKQCTILWHVDNLKISHVSKQVVEDVLRQLLEKFGQESPLTVSRGRVLEYLGMKIDY